MTYSLWTARTPWYTLKAAGGEITIERPDGNTLTVAKGHYTAGVLSPDGNWLVAGSFCETIEPVRVDMASHAVERVPIDDPVKGLQPLAYVPAHRKVLLGWSINFRQVGYGYLYDPVTRKAEKVTGELRPLKESIDSPSRRPLQPTGRADEVWAALRHTTPVDDDPDAPLYVGRYNTRTFQFTDVLPIPFGVGSFDMWVDVPGGRVYFVLDGHLLSLPLPQPSSQPAPRG